MLHRCLAAALVVVGVAALGPAMAAAQSAAEAPSLRTAWGDPALSGIWDFRSITPLQRPVEFTDREFLTEEEAANLEQANADRELELLLRPARRTRAGGNVDRGEDGALGAYNDFWLDRGTTTQTTRRTSLIIDPPNGRMPPLTAEAQQRRAERAAYRREHPADSWEDRGLNDRCMFTTGLPMVPSAYNNNVHIFQNPDHVAMVIEMTHTLRVVPLDDRPRSEPPIRQFVGESRGRWEGDTLVVETMHFNRFDRPARVDARCAPGRALHARRAGHHRVRVHHRGPGHVDAPVDGAGGAEADRRAALRVRLPRGQLLDGGDPRRSTRGRAEGRRGAVTRTCGRVGSLRRHEGLDGMSTALTPGRGEPASRCRGRAG